MSGWDREAEAQARLIGWMIFLTIKAIALCVRALWWLLFRHAWALVALAVFAVNLGLLASPETDERSNGLFLVLVGWAALGLAWPRANRAFKARRARKLAAVAAGRLEKPEARAWVVSKLPTGAQAPAATGLRVWAGVRRVRRTIRRDLAAVHGGRVPKQVLKQWEQMVKAQEQMA